MNDSIHIHNDMHTYIDMQGLQKVHGKNKIKVQVYFGAETL